MKKLIKTFFVTFLGLSPTTTILAGNPLKMVIGTYTGSGSKGIYSFDFDQETGRATRLHTLNIQNPSYLTISKDGKFIYAVSENNDKTAALNCISFDTKSGKMMLMNSQLTNGADPCYVDVHKKLAITANYSGGSMSVFPILSNGTLGKCQQLYGGSTGGTNKKRQKDAHIHCAMFTGDGQILATDFSADRILSYKYDDKNGQVSSYDGTLAAQLTPGSGPRHIAFSPNGKFAFVINELSDKITAFTYENGRLKEYQTIRSGVPNAQGGADIHVSPDGHYLYTSNRLKSDGIAIFSISDSNGRLRKVGYQKTAIHPRNFAITPNGLYLLVACRDSNKIQVFKRNIEKGTLTNTHQDIKVTKPVCIKFY